MAGSSHDSPGIVHRFPIEGHTKCRPTEESAVEVLLWACRSPKGEHPNKGAQEDLWEDSKLCWPSPLHRQVFTHALASAEHKRVEVCLASFYLRRTTHYFFERYLVF